MCKKFLLWVAKAFVSAVIAFAFMTLFCFLYYNLPVHYDTDDGATDYSWEKNKFYSRATEGFALGKTNNEGYLNKFDYDAGMDVEILVMGSSHMEAYNVAQDQSTAAQLASKLGDDVVYNIGTSGHNFMICADNLEAAVNKYKPKYVVVETSNLTYSDGQLEEATKGEVADLKSQSGGLLGLLQKNPFLRLMYSQLQAFRGIEENQDVVTDTGDSAKYGKESSYDALLSHMGEVAQDAGATLVIVYQPSLSLNADGTASILKKNELTHTFATLCEKNGIEFVDMSENFLQEYDENHILPHGFANTSVGTGHLNADGHRMIAEALYEIIGEDK